MTEEIKIDEILAEADRVINGERRDQYGNAEDSFDLIADYWEVYLNNKLKKQEKWDLMKWPCRINAHDVAMMMALLKIARTQGGEKKKDNYVDLAGYAALAARML